MNGWSSASGVTTSTCELWCSRPLAPPYEESATCMTVYVCHGTSPNTATSGGTTRLIQSHTLARSAPPTLPVG
jgi:hypothetical protein